MGNTFTLGKGKVNKLSVSLLQCPQGTNPVLLMSPFSVYLESHSDRHYSPLHSEYGEEAETYYAAIIRRALRHVK